MIDTEPLADGEFVTVWGDFEQCETCPNCACARKGWDCDGCGYGFTA